MAFIVKPVKPNVGFISTDASAILCFSPREFCKSLAVGMTASTWMLLLNLPAAGALGAPIDPCDRRTQKLERTGLKTIVVMAGGCALQTSPHLAQPPDLAAAPRTF